MLVCVCLCMCWCVLDALWEELAIVGEPIWMFRSCRLSIEYIFVKAYWVGWDFGGVILWWFFQLFVDMCIVQGQGYLWCDVREMRMHLLLVGRDESFFGVYG